MFTIKNNGFGKFARKNQERSISEIEIEIAFTFWLRRMKRTSEIQRYAFDIPTSWKTNNWKIDYLVITRDLCYSAYYWINWQETEVTRVKDLFGIGVASLYKEKY